MFWLAVFILTAAGSVQAQSTAQSSVAPELRECYTDPRLVDRNNLPPTTMPVLIDIIRKIEDNPNVNVDLRQLTVLLLQTYRQDGIEFHRPEGIVGSTTNILPFAPTFHSYYRHKLLLTRIIPANLQTLANDTIDSNLKCALHQMLSTTIDARVRGDENNCNQLAQYRALRTSRGIKRHLMKNDVEILDVAALNSANQRGHLRQLDPNDDVEVNNFDSLMSERQIVGASQCPLANGVVFTRWGAVSAGNVLAGIAGGAQSQTISITELAKGSIINQPNVQQFVTSIYPSTLSGDLAEAVLIQNTERGNPAISIGAAGNWNSTQAPRFFMLNSRNNVEMTDPEIRGDIDGFVLGTLVNTVLQGASTLRLSQLLDMYYSARNGVMDSARRACNRQSLSQELIPIANLRAETLAFSAALDTNMPLRGTIMGGLEQPVNSAITNFQSYTTNNLNDLNCATTESTTNDFRLRTNLYLVVDVSWQYQAIYPAISFLLDSIEVGKFGSSVTLLTTFDGSVVINKTFSLADFHSEYTAARHQAMLAGVNLETSLRNIRTLMQNELDAERSANYVGGNSTVLLFLLNTAVQNNQLIRQEARTLNETVPDLRILFATSTNQQDVLWDLVREMHGDIATISLNTAGTGVNDAMRTILGRIELVGRRIINPLCGSNYPPDASSGQRQFDDFVEPGYINFYTVSPNYFYGNNDNRRIRITRTGVGVGSLIICQSREWRQPRQNFSGIIDQTAITCETITTTGSVDINLRGACEGHWTIGSCPLLHISVQSSLPLTGVTLSSTCTVAACRFPYDIRYQVQINDFGCFSGCGSITISLGLLIFGFLLNFV